MGLRFYWLECVCTEDLGLARSAGTQPPFPSLHKNENPVGFFSLKKRNCETVSVSVGPIAVVHVSVC